MQSQPDAADRDLVAAALRKTKAGEKLNPPEAAALKRFRVAAEEADRWRYYATIPKKHWVKLSGRQHKILDEQASRYQLPVLGSVIDLGAVARWLHDFLARNATKLKPGDDDVLVQGDSNWAERYRKERALLVRLDRREREQALVSRERSHQCWIRVAGVLRRAGETLQRQFGPTALRILNQALEDAEREVDSVFADGNSTKPDRSDDRRGDSVVPDVGSNS